MSVFERMLSDGRHLVVTDTETTGTRAHHHQVIEIGAIRIDSDASRTTFSELVDPGKSIPHAITRITGITTSMVRGRPTIATVLPHYMGLLEDGVFVAHNIGFDVSFLNAELERVGSPPIENEGLCTLRLARRLLPGLRSKSLGNLARFFRIPSEGRHRALRDAEITTEVLARLAGIAEEEHGVVEIDELMQMQRRTYARVNPHSKHVLRIRKEILPDLPAEPGVYFMKDGRGTVIYVGKARVLSNRVRSYFNAIEAHPPRIRQLVSRIRDICWETHSTELEALVEESRQIKDLDPAFNRAQKRYIARPYLRLGMDETAPRLTVQVISREDGGEYYGPIRSRAEAAMLVEIVERQFKLRTCSVTEFETGKPCMRADIGRCWAPCERTDLDGKYGVEVERVRAFLRGDIADVCAALEDDMNRASAKMAFEEAARYRDWITLLDAHVARTGTVVTPVDGPACVYVLPGTDSEPWTCAVLRKGVLIDVFGLVRSMSDVEFAARIRTAVLSAVDDSAGLERTRADARRILEHWLNINRNRVEAFERRENESAEAFSGRVSESVFEAG